MISIIAAFALMFASNEPAVQTPKLDASICLKQPTKAEKVTCFEKLKIQREAEKAALDAKLKQSKDRNAKLKREATQISPS